MHIGKLHHFYPQRLLVAKNAVAADVPAAGKNIGKHRLATPVLADNGISAATVNAKPVRIPHTHADILQRFADCLQ